MNCTLVPGMKSMSEIVCEIWLILSFLWPLTFTCDLQHHPEPLGHRGLTSLSIRGIKRVPDGSQVCMLQHMSKPLAFTLTIRCTLLCCCILVPGMKFVGSIEFEIWTIVCQKLKQCHYDVITHLNLMKFKHKCVKGIPKRQHKFHFYWK